MPFFGSVSTVKASATLLDKTLLELGTAEVSIIRKVSEDRKKALISISISRLPDTPVSSVTFSGMVWVPVARGVSQRTYSLDLKVGTRIEIGLGNVMITGAESNSLTLKGGDQLSQIAELKIIKPDGTKIKGERGGYAKQSGTEGVLATSQWSFGAPISPGKVEVSLYDGLVSIEVPIKLSVAKPY